MTDLKVIEEILAATSHKDIFASNDPADVSIVFKKYARFAHPDLYSDPNDKKKANQAFLSLNTYRDQALGKVSAMKTNTIVTPKRTYEVVETFPSDSIFSNFLATYGDHQVCHLMVTNAPRDNDLAENYASKLALIHSKVPAQYTIFYYPELLEKFTLEQNGAKHIGLAHRTPTSFYSLTEIKNAYPNGLTGRNVAWIFKRMLLAVGNAHDIGLVHGGLSDDAFLIQAENHGLKLRNWQYSVNEGEHLKAIEPEMEDFYPDEILVEKKPATWKHDIHMLSHIAENMLDPDDAPDAFYTFFKGCRISSLPPAKELLMEFDDLLKRIYGEPKFSVLAMPQKP